MLKHLYTFICSGTSLDAQDGTLSAFNIIDNFNVPILPNEETPIEQQLDTGVLIPMMVHCVTGWLIDENDSEKVTGDVDFIKSIYNDKKNKIAEISTPLTIGPDQKRFNIREALNGMPLKGTGNYTFVVQIKKDGKLIAKSDYPFTVQLQNIQ